MKKCAHYNVSLRFTVCRFAITFNGIHRRYSYVASPHGRELGTGKMLLEGKGPPCFMFDLDLAVDVVAAAGVGPVKVGPGRWHCQYWHLRLWCPELHLEKMVRHWHWRWCYW